MEAEFAAADHGRGRAAGRLADLTLAACPASRTHRGMSTFNENDHPRGRTGQFEDKIHLEPTLSLSVPANPLHDADGNEWDTDGDEYTSKLVSNVGGIRIEVSKDIRGEEYHLNVSDHRGGRPIWLAKDVVDSVDEGKERGKALRERAHQYEHNKLETGMESPWGTIDNHSPLAPGIDDVWTAGHGGYKLSAKRAAEVDPAWGHRGPWFEEDCAWSIAAITHHKDLTKIKFKDAHETARRYYPDEYEAVVGKNPERYGLTEFTPITAKESAIVAEREFLAPRAETHDRMLRLNLDPEGHPGMVAVDLSDIPADGKVNDEQPLNPRTVLITAEEWKDAAPAWHERRTLPKVADRAVFQQAS